MAPADICISTFYSIHISSLQRPFLKRKSHAGPEIWKTYPTTIRRKEPTHYSYGEAFFKYNFFYPGS